MINDMNIVAFASLALDSRKASVFSAIWKKKLLNFSTSASSQGNVPYLVIDQYTAYLGKERSFVLDWLRQQTADQTVNLQAFDGHLYLNDSGSIFELNLNGQVTRTIPFKGALQISNFILDFDVMVAFVFDFRSGKVGKYDWTSQILNYENLNLEERKITSIAKDAFGHFFLLDDLNRSILILDHGFKIVGTIEIHAIEKMERKSSKTVELFSKLKATGMNQVKMIIEVVDEAIYLCDNGIVSRLRYC